MYNDFSLYSDVSALPLVGLATYIQVGYASVYSKSTSVVSSLNWPHGRIPLVWLHGCCGLLDVHVLTVCHNGLKFPST